MSGSADQSALDEKTTKIAAEQPTDAAASTGVEKTMTAPTSSPLSEPQDGTVKDDEALPLQDVSSSADVAQPSLSPKGKEKELASIAADKDSTHGSLAIGPTDAELPPIAPSTETSVCNITLLLPTGARHPYRLDEKYLAKRGVEVPDLTESGHKDPFSISVYTLKELILREWRDEWDARPASPSSIRLIHFGKLLDDKEQLQKYQFSAESPNVVHMSVRPAEMLEEDEAAKGKTSSREGRNNDNGTRCCVIL